jgi:hypothetical protein
LPTLFTTKPNKYRRFTIENMKRKINPTEHTNVQTFTQFGKLVNRRFVVRRKVDQMDFRGHAGFALRSWKKKKPIFEVRDEPVCVKHGNTHRSRQRSQKAPRG